MSYFYFFMRVYQKRVVFFFVRCKYMTVFIAFQSVLFCFLLGTLPQTFPKSAIVLKMQMR